MEKKLLEISQLSVSVASREVLTKVDLSVGKGEITALMGANGSGKTSLAQTLLGNGNFNTEAGKVTFMGKDLLSMSIDERSRAGLYVAWQNPVAVPGVSVLSYLRVIYEAHGNKIETLVKFREQVRELLHTVGLTDEVLQRNLNEGFSGGEKKRFELLQLILLRPRLAILDEIDSGLDVDGLRMVSEIIGEMKETAFILITHYKKLLDYVKVDKVVVLVGGRVVASGGNELVEEIEKVGYAKFR